MTPAKLSAESFQNYQPRARALAISHLELLRSLPLSFVPLLLREVIAYDRKFPAERRELLHQLSYLASLTGTARGTELSAFGGIRVGENLAQINWVDEPARFSEALSAHLWSTHQIDLFHSAAVAYMNRANAGFEALAPEQARVAMVIIGQGVRDSTYPLFRKLRSRGLYLTNVDPEEGLSTIASWLAARSANASNPYVHWAISGSAPFAGIGSGVTQVSYEALAAPREAMSAILRSSFEHGMSAELLRSRLAAMRPSEIGLDPSKNPAAAWFQLSLLAEGSGTQIFSTSFVQWAAREALRRAQPSTLVCRFSPRQQASSMKDLLSPASARNPVLDPEGSLIDADMAAYQTWLNLERLPGASDTKFLCWFEGHREMLVIAPGISADAKDNRKTTWAEVTHRFLGA